MAFLTQNSKPLGVSPCDLIFPENPLETLAAHLLTWYRLRASCPQKQTAGFEEKHFILLITAPIVVPVPQLFIHRGCVSMCADQHPVYTVWWLLPVVENFNISFKLDETSQTFSLNLAVLTEFLSILSIFVTNSSSSAKTKEQRKKSHTHNKLLGQLVRGIIHSWKEALCSCKKTIAPARQQDI